VKKIVRLKEKDLQIIVKRVLKEQVEELYDSLGPVLKLATIMCNDHYDDDPVDIMDPEEALLCLYDIGTDRSDRLIKMIEYYMNQIVYQESNGIG
jgi:hypothetical protein